MKNKKNVFSVCLIIIMLISTLLIGCGNSDKEMQNADNKASISQETESETIADESETGETTAETSGTVKPTEPAAPTEKNDVTTVAPTERTTEKTEAASNPTEKSVPATAKPTEKANEPEADKTETTEPQVQVTEPATTSETEPTTEAAKVCYITIEGYCSNKSVEMKNGESVYDILKKSGANVSARNTGYGLYVEGINGRFEFDEGPTSGWVYTVNGTRPSTGCSHYKVSSGDKIVWSYVEEV